MPRSYSPLPQKSSVRLEFTVILISRSGHFPRSYSALIDLDAGFLHPPQQLAAVANSKIECAADPLFFGLAIDERTCLSTTTTPPQQDAAHHGA